MEASFWQERWADNRIGFHQSRVNSRLMHWWPTLDLPAGSCVFVPLCGKSLDMLWLLHAGYRVLGIELSERAVHDFFSENALEYERRVETAFTWFRGVGAASGIQIGCGDFFALQAGAFREITACYDRAALIAMPDSMRRDYTEQLARVLPTGTSGLLLTIDYQQSRMTGPPFAVTDAHARELLSPYFSMGELEFFSGPERLGSLKERGLDTIDEYVYRLSRNANPVPATLGN